MTSSVSVLVVGPAGLLPTAEQALRSLGAAVTCWEPHQPPPQDLTFDLAIALLTTDTEHLWASYEASLFQSAADVLIEEGDGREAWSAEQWGKAWEPRIGALQHKAQSSSSVLAPTLETPLGGELEEEWGSMTFPAATPPQPVDSPTPNTNRPTRRFPGLVFVGAGVGGPAALRSFLAEVPPGLPTPLVVYQPLPHGRQDALANTLGKVVSLPLSCPASGEALLAGQAYILAQHQGLGLNEQGQWQTEEASSDHLLAHLQQDNAVIVLLSGAPSHWLLSILESMAAGALVLLQSPATAFDATLLQALEGMGAVAESPEQLGAYVSEYLRKESDPLLT